jgi:hypothetical protein
MEELKEDREAVLDHHHSATVPSIFRHTGFFQL